MVGSGSTARARIFAPNGTLTVASGAQLLGTVIARDVLISSGAQVVKDVPVTQNCSADDQNPCTEDSCNALGQPVFTPVPAGTSCADANSCNGEETCNGVGACAPGVAPTVDDGNPCTTDTCDPKSGVAHSAAPGTLCSDGNACNGVELCNASGQCGAGSAPVVDDGNPCTVDRCDPTGGVRHQPVVTDTDCSDGNACNGVERCNASGLCTAGSPPALDDGNRCTIDSCDPTLGVVHAPVAVGTACSDGNACNGIESCDATGSCTAGVAPSWDDGNPCTADACDPALGVTHFALANGTECSDDNACNGVEACRNGACSPGSAPAIDDQNPCTADSCDPTAGVLHAPVADGTSCSDGNACNGVES
jgi:hypothetical protein